MRKKQFLIIFIFIFVITNIALFLIGSLTWESSGLISRQIGFIIGVGFVSSLFSIIVSLLIHAIYGSIRMILDKKRIKEVSK